MVFRVARSGAASTVEVAHDGNRLILNDQELRAQFATPGKPLSINHLLGPSFVNEAGNQQVFTFVQMQPYSEVYLRWATTSSPRSSASRAWATSWRRTPAVNVRGPITLRYLRFKLTDYEGNVVDLRGASLSFCIYLDG